MRDVLQAALLFSGMLNVLLAGIALAAILSLRTELKHKAIIDLAKMPVWVRRYMGEGAL
jgi:hypothetical protein